MKGRALGVLFLILWLGMWVGCMVAIEVAYPPGAHGQKVSGIASWYGPGFYGQTTANMEVYTGQCLTAATRSLPLNVCARITRFDTGASVVVWLNDRGPYVDGRVVDLSYAAAFHLGMLDIGIAPAKVEVVDCETEREETIW